nr:hypothetical protein [Pseudomonas sp. P818]
MTDFMERLRRKALMAKPCPFCGSRPRFRFDIAAEPTSVGHYAIRHKCCSVTQLGQTELFFHSKPAVGTFKSMAYRLLRDWNRREARQP